MLCIPNTTLCLLSLTYPPTPKSETEKDGCRFLKKLVRKKTDGSCEKLLVKKAKAKANANLLENQRGTKGEPKGNHGSANANKLQKKTDRFCEKLLVKKAKAKAIAKPPKVNS